jgi:hypothetical protein
MQPQTPATHAVPRSDSAQSAFTLQPQTPAVHSGPRPNVLHSMHWPGAPQLLLVSRHGAVESGVAAGPSAASFVVTTSTPEVPSRLPLPASADPASKALPPQDARASSKTTARRVDRLVNSTSRRKSLPSGL